MKKAALLFAVMMLSLQAFAQSYDTDFSCTRRLKISGKTTEMSGHLTYDGKERLDMDYSDPEGDWFRIDGTSVDMNLLGKKAKLQADKVPMVALQRSTLLNCLKGDWEQAAEDNNATSSVSEKIGFRTVKLTAGGAVPRGGYRSITIQYRLKDSRITRLILEELAGVEYTYEIK